ncbi:MULTISPECIES: TIGR04222 domain-containing membrane protein [unclassified Streptomyces]|uniref:TIGR04222 domain-containing membrane protein n=1 Tax=unclassified Streptomyces TaxID=2593676 RepID=UPI0022717DE0|nr:MULTISPECIES: TIGR04222 domain-containing membrane protein [unclassified Streptomyces]MCY0920483.1 TIGR04222 domain-containing membrane protein [Streptomyces sp. H27-G5]MCY0956423.1 TIGR04222 domain-containing membrane protein [Streptomyces sp. H27-H5]
MNILAVAVWIGVIVSTVLLLRGLRASRPPAAPSDRLHDLSEAAFIAGGPGAVVDSALVSLFGDGRLMVGGPGIAQARPGARAHDAAERAVLLALRLAPSGWLYQVRYAAMSDPSVQEIGDALAHRGLLSPPGTGRPWRLWGILQAAACGLLLVLSLPLTIVSLAMSTGPRVPFIVLVFPALLGGIVLGSVAARRAGRRVTPSGRAALGEFRAHYLNDHTPHVQTALFGLRGLRDPFLRQQLVPAARSTRLAAAQSRARTGPHRSHASSGSGDDMLPVLVWCAGSATGTSGCGSSGSGSGCGGGGASCSGGGSGCGSSGSGCGGSGGGSSCSSSGSSCSSSSSSCSSSSGSSCSSSS